MIALAVVGASFALDEPVRRWVEVRRTATWRELGRDVSLWLDWPLVIALTGVVALAARWWRPRLRWAPQAAAIFLGAAAAGLAATTLRSVIGRTRPGAQVEQGWYGPKAHGRWVVGRYAYGAFPSGHTAAVAGLVGALFVVRPAAAAATFGLIPVVGAARIVVGAHRFSDVAAAATLGLTIGAWVARRSEARPTPGAATRRLPAARPVINRL